MKRLLLAISAFALPLLCGFPSYANETADSVSVQVYFKKNVAIIEPDFRNNKALLDKFVSGVKKIMSDTTCKVQDILIRSGASPEGKFDRNKELSWERALALKSYLRSELGLPDHKFIVAPVGEDWATLVKLVEKSDAPDKEEILSLLGRYSSYINGSPRSTVGGPKKELMDLNGGKTWFWLLKNIFPDLRSAGNTIVCRYTRIGQEKTVTHSADTVVVIHKYILEIDTVRMHGLIGPGYRLDLEADLQLDTLSSQNVQVKLSNGKNVNINIIE